MMSAGVYFIGSKEVKIIPKGNLDHSELDKSYFIKKMKNESQLVDKRAELKESKKKLREFESNIDNEMPSLQRLKDFKKIAQELVENPNGRTRRHISSRRTKRETEELYQKLKALERENPDMDLTTLFESHKAEEIRRAMHRRAF